MQRNLSQEAHLWYVITSPQHMLAARDALQEAFDFLLLQVRLVPDAIDHPSVAFWGDKIKGLLDEFDHDLSMLKHGDFQAMIGWEGQLGSIPRGFDEGVRWMPEHDEFMRKLNVSVSIAGRFWLSLVMSQMYCKAAYKNGSVDWHHEIPEDMGIAGDGIARYYEDSVFLMLPEEIPEYAPDESASCKTGEIVPWTGVWVPSMGMGSAALAFARQGIQIMQSAYEIVSVDEDGEADSYELVDCVWHPVKPTGRMIKHPVMAKLRQELANARLRCEAGQRCPREGIWFTPAVADLRHFELGEVMPEIKSDYGHTIWQWSQQQP